MDNSNFEALRAMYPDIRKRATPIEVYRFLEGKMRKYVDYAGVTTEPNGEKLVPIQNSRYLTAKQIGSDMRPFTGNDVYVREQVLEKLLNASRVIGKLSSGSQLEVVYGYRALSVQTALFERIKGEILAKGFEGNDAELLEAVHRLVAVPNVAGHPTGGAVDVQIIEEGQPIDMGTPIWDFSEDSYSFSPYISEEAWTNRYLLRNIMEDAEFVPFDGEWWHYSYGDPEWATAVNAPYAIYDQVEFNTSLVS